MNPEKLQITVQEGVPAATRLDRFLADYRPECSRAYYKRLIDNGSVLLNGHPCCPDNAVKTGDVLDIILETEVRELKPDENIPLNVVYEDDFLLAVNKPPGLVVHPAAGHDTGTLVHALMAHCPGKDFEEMLDDDMRPGIVHRLDMDTSGLLLAAKNASTMTKLKNAFKQHEISKIYVAIVHGILKNKSGRINLPIGRHPRNRKKMAVVSQGGKEAVSDYKVISQCGDYSFVRILLHTGRTHQIRVHFSHTGHSVLGDKLYGSHQADVTLAPRQMLHAWKLAFKHPETGENISLKAAPPDDFMCALQQLGLNKQYQD